MPVPADIQSLDVILTAGCNLRCTYCYQNDKKSRRMDWETLRASVDLLLRSNNPQVDLLFIGGEPLLEFPLIQRAVEYVERSASPGKRVRFHLYTNGTLLKEEHAAFLAEHGFEMQLSFDGVPAAQDFRGRGTFAELDRLLDRLRERYPRFFTRALSVNITLMPATLRHLTDSVDYFLAKEVADVKISPAVAHHPDWTPDRITELDDQFSRIFRSCLRIYRRTGRVPLALFRHEAEDSPHRPRNMAMCGASRGENLAVDVDGQVHGCVMFAESYQVIPTRFLRTRLDPMKLGDFRDASFPARLAAYPAAARAAGIFDGKDEKYSSYGRCRECRFLGTCGVCPMSIGHQPGNEDPHRIPDFACAFNLVSLEYRERFPAQPPLLDLIRQSRRKLERLHRSLVTASAGEPRSSAGRRRVSSTRAKALGSP
jgi:sulfatase maturation enzyme AslB (radical SAM superfamily)